MKKYVALFCVVLGMSMMLCACREEDESAPYVEKIESSTTDCSSEESEKAEDEGQEDMKAADGEAALAEENAIETPGADVVNLVNLRGDETTAYKLVDGTYMDRIDRRFTYNGTDTWTDENGAEWNETVDVRD